MKKDKLKKFAVLLIFPLHLMLCWLFEYGSPADYLYFGAVLTVLLIDFALSAWQLEIFTSHRNSIRVFAKEYLPYLLQKGIILAADAGLFGIGLKLQYSLGYCVSVGLAAASLLLSALVAFVTGAARTMMYHDEKR